MKIVINILLISLLILLSTIHSFSKPQSDDSIFVSKVFLKLLKVVEPVNGFHWPPEIKITKDTAINAGASDNEYNINTNSRGYRIYLSKGLLNKLVSQDENVLSFIISHELAHIISGHLKNKNKPELIKSAIVHAEELEADKVGIKIAIDAGFPINYILKGIKAIATSYNNFSSYESLSKEHPSWSQRLSALDSLQKDLWHSISAFKNGIAFLEIEQWTPAINCFKQVAKQFPNCSEAYANLGYAKLMKYIELLEPENIEDLKYTHIVTGTYYKTSASLDSRIRGVDTDIWWEAVGDLHRALTLNENLTLAKANLGLAYLIGPMGESRFGKSSQYYSEAITMIDKDSSISTFQKAAIYFNSGISNYLTGKDDSLSDSFLKLPEKYKSQFGEFSQSKNEYLSQEIRCSDLYNKAFSLSKSNSSENKMEALKLFEDYLKVSNKNSPWFTTGKEEFEVLSRELNYKSTNQQTNHLNSFRKIVGIRTKDSIEINLSEQTWDLFEKFKNFNKTEVTLIPKRNLKRVKISDVGLELLTSDYIFAIILNDSISPSIYLSNQQKSSINSRLFVGMKLDAFDDLLEGMNFKENISLLNTRNRYRYYKELGLGARLNYSSRKVDEFVITNLDGE